LRARICAGELYLDVPSSTYLSKIVLVRKAYSPTVIPHHIQHTRVSPRPAQNSPAR
jgi:hypothetical protein